MLLSSERRNLIQLSSKTGLPKVHFYLRNLTLGNVSGPNMRLSRFHRIVFSQISCRKKIFIHKIENFANLFLYFLNEIKKNWNVFRKIVNLLRGLGEKISGVGKSIKEIIPCSKIVCTFKK